MKIYSLKTVLISLYALLLTCCVSIDISDTKVKKADGVQFNAPPLPFKEFESADIDKGWRNSSNGNTITFVTDCENPYDPSLVSIEEGVVAGLQSLKKTSSVEGMYNDRASQRSVFTGTVDGIPSKIQLMTFKKNSCIYIITYFSVEKHYVENEMAFDSFLKGFSAP